MFWMFKQIYWSLEEDILEQYWRVLYSGLKVVSNNYYFQYVFTLTAGKMATAIAHQRTFLEIQKPEEILS
jgi:hypothetical protein